VADAYFRRHGGDDSAGTYLASGLTAGPWSPALQHGGPPNALAVLIADRVVRAAGDRSDLVPLRLAADFAGPVPVGEIAVTTHITRLARSAAACEVTVSAGGRECQGVRVWFVRDADTAALASPIPSGPPPPPADLAHRPHSSGGGWGFGYASSLRWWFTDGAATTPGPAAAWVLPLHPILDEQPGELPGLARAALVADSASGISAELDWAQWSFINVDLDLHLARPFAGEAVHLAAVTTVGDRGSALARSTISDARGPVGAGLQTLVVAPMPTA